MKTKKRKTRTVKKKPRVAATKRAVQLAPVSIHWVVTNNRKKAFVVEAQKQLFEMPYSRLVPRPTKENPVTVISIEENERKSFSYVLASGESNTVNLDTILGYAKDPDYLRDLLLYQLSQKAQKLIKEKAVRKREIMRRLRTSPTQLYRLLDHTFYGKTIDQMIRLLAALDCNVEFVFNSATDTTSASSVRM